MSTMAETTGGRKKFVMHYARGRRNYEVKKYPGQKLQDRLRSESTLYYNGCKTTRGKKETLGNVIAYRSYSPKEKAREPNNENGKSVMTTCTFERKKNNSVQNPTDRTRSEKGIEAEYERSKKQLQENGRSIYDFTE